MSIQPKLKELVFASFNIEEHNPLYTKILILNAFLFITTVTAGSLFLFNTLWANNIRFAIIDIAILLPILYALFLLRKKCDYRMASYISTGVLFVGYLAVIILMKGKDFSLIWSYFFAPFSMIILSARKGLYLSILFILFALFFTYLGVGSWQQGAWDIPSYMRFVISQIVMLYVIYAITDSNEKAQKRVEALRQRENAQLKLFEKLSITDPLTSLYNRRSLKEIFPREFYAAQRDNNYFAYLLLDIDYFKPYNDTYGHQKGDDVLIETAALIRQTCKYAFRIGGDEFAGIIIDAERKKIKKKILSLQHMIEEMHIENRESPISPWLTCSIGVHIIQAYEYDFEEIYSTADNALYKAKALGRNQVVFL